MERFVFMREKNLYKLKNWKSFTNILQTATKYKSIFGFIFVLIKSGREFPIRPKFVLNSSTIRLQF
jgi:hypothetical protein